MNAITKVSGFTLQPENLKEAMELSAMLSNSDMVPKLYRNKPQDTLIAMMMGAELGLNPIQSLQNIAVINHKPSIYGDALLALVQNHPAFGGVEETFDEAAMTASCTAWRKGGTKHTQTFSQADAVSAQLWGKQGPWTQYPKRMLQWRARGFALRDQFADALGGLITIEEARDIKDVDLDDGANYIEHKPAKENEKISSDQVAEITEALAARGISEDRFLVKARVEKISLLEASRFDTAMKTIKSSPLVEECAETGEEA
ncbi:MAG: hypothetical protein QNK32_01985 [Porticoccus sp.]|nr:hypothetical protein [Porticoccus sp.]